RPDIGCRAAVGYSVLTCVCARQIDRSPGVEPAPGSKAAVQPDLYLHQPRFERRAVPQRPRAGDVSRAGGGDRPDRRDLRAAAAPLHTGAAGVAAVDGPGKADRGAADYRRSAQPDRPALRLPVSHSLSILRGRVRDDRSDAGYLARAAIACRGLSYARPVL